MASILDTSSLYSTYNQSIQNANSSLLEEKLDHTDSNSSDEELMGVCKNFEAYFVQKVIEQARKTFGGEEEEENEYMKYFGDMRNEQYANILTESGSVGLAQQLYDSMKSSGNF